LEAISDGDVIQYKKYNTKFVKRHVAVASDDIRSELYPQDGAENQLAWIWNQG